jgi:hypothetical protein
MRSLRNFVASVVCLLCLGSAAPAQELRRDLQDKLDALVAGAYKAASAGLPCKVKAGGKPRMIRWQDVDECLNDAAGQVDWEAFRAELVSIRAAAGISADDIESITGAAFSARALPFEKVFELKNPEVYLPLTNSLLKFLPADSLQGLEVIDKTGKEIGTFAGTYYFEGTGGLNSANTYRLTLFQYTDPLGNVQAAKDKLLLGSFGVRWPAAKPQPGFRFANDKLKVPDAK